MTKPPAPRTFQSLLTSATLPPPGPEYFAARRALWITPTAASRLTLQKPGSEVSDTVLVPLRTAIKIVHAGWRRDGTWPDNAAVVDDDNFFGTIDPHANRSANAVTPEGG